MNHNRVVTEWREPAWRSQLKNLLAYSKTQVVWRNDPHYGETVKIFNRIHEERPAVFVSTLQPEVIKEVFALARRESIPVSIRGGGHHIAGFSLCQDGIVIDFSPFRGVAYDPKTQIAHVQPGARLRDVDQTLCPLGRVVPSGTISDTGIAGLTLGGGIGWLIGRYGLTCDSLVGADVVLTDGRHLRAEDPGHEGLLWALRGGGGNFGAVTAFRYRTHPLPRFQMGSGIIDADASFAPLSRVLAFLETAAPTTLSVAPVLAAGENGRRVLSIDYCMADPCDSVIENLITASGPSVTWRHYHNMPFHDWTPRKTSPFWRDDVILFR
jgi:FAD/FMN-containing dehydrogenase